MFSTHLASMFPVYGRSRGTGHGGLLFYNRGAEPLLFDPLNPKDRKKNGHMLILGPTGAGKSALLGLSDDPDARRVPAASFYRRSRQQLRLCLPIIASVMVLASIRCI